MRDNSRKKKYLGKCLARRERDLNSNQYFGRLTSPEIDEILLFERRHFLYDRPQPALEVLEPLRGLARLVVEGGVADQGGNVDVADLKLEKNSEKLKSVPRQYILVTRKFNIFFFKFLFFFS